MSFKKDNLIQNKKIILSLFEFTLFAHSIDANVQKIKQKKKYSAKERGVCPSPCKESINEKHQRIKLLQFGRLPH